MLAEERFSIIMNILEQSGSVTVQYLMKELDASESTIRRDLNTLDAAGKLTKVYGGAILKGTTYSTKDDDVLLRKGLHKEDKFTIARYAAGLIGPDDFVYLDAGTTTELMIDYIQSKSATFVTNAVAHAKKLADLGFRVYILGGEFKAATEAIVGDEAIDALAKYNFTKGFWGANGVSVQKGFSTPDVKEAMIKKKSMESCKERYILCDNSKFSQLSCVTFAPFESATILTTGLSQETYKKYKNIVEVSG